MRKANKALLIVSFALAFVIFLLTVIGIILAMPKKKTGTEEDQNGLLSEGESLGQWPIDPDETPTAGPRLLVSAHTRDAAKEGNRFNVT